MVRQCSFQQTRDLLQQLCILPLDHFHSPGERLHTQKLQNFQTKNYSVVGSHVARFSENEFYHSMSELKVVLSQVFDCFSAVRPHFYAFEATLNSVSQRAYFLFLAFVS